jgi:hypothetical protein
VQSLALAIYRVASNDRTGRPRSNDDHIPPTAKLPAPHEHDTLNSRIAESVPSK